jgi:hypothetical protein
VRSNGFGFQVEMNYLCRRAGLHLVEVPIVFPDRTAGRSKMSLRITMEAALLVWRLRRGATSSQRAHAPGTAAPATVEPPSTLAAS